MKSLRIKDWDLTANEKGELMIQGCNTVEIAAEFGTPLHIVNEPRLSQAAEEFLSAVKSEYPGCSSVHYPFKCNSVPGIVEIIKQAGFQAEVVTEFELELAFHLGYSNNQIIVNGPSKSNLFLQQCVQKQVKLVVVDSLEELLTLNAIAENLSKVVKILLRINPDYTPQGMNEGSATGSRKGCAFGLDLKGEEVIEALRLLRVLQNVKFKGVHFHIGTGIRNPKDYFNALRCLQELINLAMEKGFPIDTIDVGGGFASATSREMTASELLIYQAFGKLPSPWKVEDAPSNRDYINVISHEIFSIFKHNQLPELIFEPGRCITSSNQLLLLTVQRIKSREGIGKWLITDGGLSTVTLPTYYEYHEVFLCNDVNRERTEKVNIIGPACFAGDIIYRNKWMPLVKRGEIIAVMDTGAYFTAMESSFGFPKPAIVAVSDGEIRLIRERETFQQMIQRDVFNEVKEVIL